MNLFKTMNISASGMTAQGFRMDVIAQNIANANTTRTADGGPYQRKTAILGKQPPSFRQMMQDAGQRNPATGVQVVATVTDESAGAMVFDPQHPDADEQGYVIMPNVDIAREYIDMISATRSYEANLTVMNATKRMAQKALDISR